ncbi:MAG: DNA gyrase subunit A [Candidatus Nanoarchaeia archaeon]|nr:DNA gyrase subunit A [Candidatus Nanoarchaeia archaeon]
MDENNDIKIEANDSHIVSGILEDEMKSAYLDYAMSVIIGRALPDVRDGLKPVHRRILYAMNDMGITFNKSYKKCARIVGEVLGKYHPHGDSAVYESLVRMAQEFSLRYPLVQGQGNFGSVDGDNAAAMRYTEARMSKICDEMLKDIEKETVNMRPNFDESLEEPVVLPTRLPNLLINGSNGIAVGMATNIPPHNISEVVDASIKVLDFPDLEIDELFDLVKGPDFPTGGIILGNAGIRQAYLTGKGKFKIRCKSHIEEKNGRKKLIVTEIPYQVNKSDLLEQIAEEIKEKRVEGISDIRDESDRKGMRIVFELKKDANEEVVQNQLFKHTRLQVGTGIIFLAIVDNQPKVLNLKEILVHFLNHRIEVVKRRTAFDLKKAYKKAHILEGLAIALNHIDAVIKLIKEADNSSVAKEKLKEIYSLSEEQSQAILEMKLQRLTGLEQNKIKSDYEETKKLILELESILASEVKIRGVVKTELEEVKEKYQDNRKTDIIDYYDDDLDIEDLIPEEDQILTISASGYIKRTNMLTYRVQNRGGTGVIGATTKEEDIIEHLFIANTHSYLLIFTNKGNVHWLKVWKVPEAGRQSKGKAIVNLVNLSENECVAAVIPVREFNEEHHLILATEKGVVKKTNLMAYSRPRQNGIIGINLDDGDKVINAVLTDGKQELLIATKKGQAVRFNEEDARSIGRTSRGVRGITLAPNDSVISMILLNPLETILTITENGYGKRTRIDDYRLINRGGKGVRNIICSERNGDVVAVKGVDDSKDILIVSQQGIIIRTRASQINVIGRNTQGVRLMRLKTDADRVQNATIAEHDDSAELVDIIEEESSE